MSFAQYARTALFPRSLEDLRDLSRCPACLNPLTDTVCRQCQLDLNHPAAHELASTSAAAAALLEKRVELIGQIRFETDQRRAELAEASNIAQPSTVAAGGPVLATGNQPVTASAMTAAAPSGTGAIVAPPAAPAVATTKRSRPSVESSVESPVAVAPRRSSVQVILLIVGVSLLSIATVFFLVYAYINYGLVWRTVIVGGLTIAAFTVASLLRRRKLVATAEGIAGFAVVLFYLDAFAIRANDFFGAGAANPLQYWGFTLLLSSVLFALWHRASRLRTASIVCFAVVTPAAGLILGGLTVAPHGGARVFVAFAAAATAGFVHPFAARSVEKLIVLSLSLASLATAFCVSFALLPLGFWALPVALFSLAGIAIVQVLLLARFPLSGPGGRAISVVAMIFAGAAGLSASLATIPDVRLTYDPFTSIVVAPVVAVTVAAALNVAWHRLPPGLAKNGARVAWISALVGCLTVLIPVLYLFAAIVTQFISSTIVSPWKSSLASTVSFGGKEYADAVLAVVLMGAVIAALSAAAGRLMARRTLLSWLAFAVVLSAVPLLRVRVDVIAAWLGVAIVASVLAISFRRVDRLALARPALIAAGFTAAVLGYGLAWGSPDVWLPASCALIVILIALRSAFAPARSGVRAALLAAGLVVAFIAAAAGADQISGHSAARTAAAMGEVRFVGLLATVILAIALVPGIPSVALTDRRTAFWMSLPVSMIAGATTLTVVVSGGVSHWVGAAFPEYLSSVVASGAFVAVIAVWTWLPSHDDRRIERQATSVLLAPALVWAFYAVARESGSTSALRGLAPIGAALVVIVVSLVLTERGHSLPTRAAREIGAGVVGLIAVLVAAAGQNTTQWRVYLIAGLILLAWAALRARSANRAERIVASVLIAPAAWVAAYSGTRVFTSSQATLELVPALCLAVVGGLSLLLSLRETTSERRDSRDIGLGTLSVVTVIAAVAGNTDLTWLVLLVSAATVLMLSLSADGLFASGRARRHLVWLALALGVAALWWRLIGAHIRNIEAFVLPLAGALLVLSFLIWRASRRPGIRVANPPAPLVFLAALLVAVIPSTLNLRAGDVAGALLLGAVSALLLLAGSFLRGTAALRPFLDALVIVGGLGVFTVAIERAIANLNTADLDARLELWNSGACVVIVLAALALTRQFGAQRLARYVIASDTLLIGGLLLILVFEGLLPDARLADARLDGVRSVVVISVFAGTHFLAQLRRSAPLDILVGWVAIGLTAPVLIEGLVNHAIRPFEFGTVPIAIALIAAGALYLSRSPQSRSWAHLAPGLGLLLGPSLLATSWDRPLWRLIAIGVAAIVVIVAAVALKLQAPFIIGVVVVLIHGVATFAPQIRAVYMAAPWWLWAGAGGILLIVLAARYERRIKNLKSASMLLGSLR